MLFEKHIEQNTFDKIQSFTQRYQQSISACIIEKYIYNSFQQQQQQQQFAYAQKKTDIEHYVSFQHATQQQISQCHHRFRT